MYFALIIAAFAKVVVRLGLRLGSAFPSGSVFFLWVPYIVHKTHKYLHSTTFFFLIWVP